MPNLRNKSARRRHEKAERKKQREYLRYLTVSAKHK